MRVSVEAENFTNCYESGSRSAFLSFETVATVCQVRHTALHLAAYPSRLFDPQIEQRRGIIQRSWDGLVIVAFMSPRKSKYESRGIDRIVSEEA